ncbi:YtxH domain-containing protein [Bacteroides propionicifaciens]|jgi:gas vesicle protein|uniref:YtxH domain-containing protein n=1 Tax=Bacteroides propionicifaciens TaxID=392838 RepID=UPI000374D08A|nr:YtxH domain-containing protein [Bacteroides propionicifaciens]
MRTLGIIGAFIGGAVIGGALGILFAPEEGEKTREKIADALRQRGINLNKREMKDLVNEIASEIKGGVDEL